MQTQICAEWDEELKYLLNERDLIDEIVENFDKFLWRILRGKKKDRRLTSSNTSSPSSSVTQNSESFTSELLDPQSCCDNKPKSHYHCIHSVHFQFCFKTNLSPHECTECFRHYQFLIKAVTNLIKNHIDYSVSSTHSESTEVNTMYKVNILAVFLEPYKDFLESWFLLIKFVDLLVPLIQLNKVNKTRVDDGSCGLELIWMIVK